MARINCDFYSKTLTMNVSATVYLPSFSTMESNYLPDEKRFDSNRRFKTLTLLHGYSGDHTIWQRRSSMELYAEENMLAIVCPSGYNGHYTDWVTGPQHLTFLEKEFLPAMQTMFPLSTRREDNFIGGLSMGGYGASKWAFTYPERFSHLINFSGGVDILPRIEYYKNKLGIPVTESVFGDLDKIENSPHDIYWLMKECGKNQKLKHRIYSCCGTEDLPVMEAHRKFVKTGRELEYDVTAFEGPGKHDFHFWDQELKKVIYQWLPLDRAVYTGGK